MEEPPDQSNPDSIWQFEFHPSPFCVFPSSQPVRLILLPSPHISVQTSGVEEVWTHLNPGSTLHCELQPSPSTLFPSSHSFWSLLLFLPSPHNIKQTSGLTGEPPCQEYPGSTAQVLEQPSPLWVLPSSHPVEEILLKLILWNRNHYKIKI